MPEELTTANDDAQEPEVEVEFPTNEEYIAACYNAIAAVDGLDTYSKEDVKRKQRILKRCLKILDECTGAMYDEIFEDRKEDEED